MVRALFFFAFALLALGNVARAEPRTALVIGNAAYSYGPLANAVNDASDMAAALTKDGFEVILKTDADQQAMDDAIAAFGDKLKAKGGVGLFYFSGHGVQSDGENYILPIGEALAREADLKYKAVNAAQVIDAMAGNGLNIVILDACRNNPLSSSGRSATRGLARVEGGSGLFVSFATSPGAVALDGDGRNSPYTKHLLDAIRTPNLSLEETFKRTLKGVHLETDGAQTPWISSSFFGDFVFDATNPATVASDAGGGGSGGDLLANKPAVQTASREAPRAVDTVEAAPQPAGVYKATGKNPNGSRYSGMVAVAPNGDGFAFTWWIGKQVLKGTGRFAGRMLVVDWGEPHPVIYNFASDGRLDGEWADGSATETLAPVAVAAAAPIAPGGRYAVAGKNPNGSRYKGTVTIAPEGDGYRLDWRVGSDSYHGTGTIAGNVLVVDWGDSTPVIYAIEADGTLAGLWKAGTGEETLTPSR